MARSQHMEVLRITNALRKIPLPPPQQYHVQAQQHLQQQLQRLSWEIAKLARLHELQRKPFCYDRGQQHETKHPLEPLMILGLWWPWKVLDSPEPELVRACLELLGSLREEVLEEEDSGGDVDEDSGGDSGEDVDE
ncbi:hypothetical protein N0V85_006850 [Neurospora sp. IMI 360204]|nr:hypothetical protein N0V85_006850 [Neurospora sp. IMI 360204]